MTLTPLMSSASVERYTPRHIVDRVVAMLGSIDLDPCAEPGKRIPAKMHYTAEDDGLTKPWWGTVFVNPPYGNGERACRSCKKRACMKRGYHIKEDVPGILEWVTHLQNEWLARRTTMALVLMPARTDTRAWNVMSHNPVCFISGRLKFTGPDDIKNSAPFPSAVFAVGTGPALLYEHFSDLGPVYERY